MAFSMFSSPPLVGGLNLRASDRTMQYKYLRDSNNIELTKAGGILKCNGYTQLNTTLLGGGSACSGTWIYYKADGSVRVIISAGTSISTMDPSSGVVSQIYNSLTPGYPVNFATFNDLVVISNGKDAPLKYDGTTVSALGGWGGMGSIETDGHFGFAIVWKNRLFASGNPKHPYRLYYSQIGTPEGWTGGGSGAGFIDIDLNDGENLTGLGVLPNILAIGRTRSWRQLTGDSAVGSGGVNEFRILPITNGRGCAAHRGIVNVGTDLYYMDQDGIASFKITAAQGGLYNDDLSYLVQPQFANANLAAMGNCFAIHHRLKQQVWFFFPTGTSTQNNTVLVYDYALGAWTIKTGFTGACGVYSQNQFPLIAGYDGNVFKHDFGGTYNASPIIGYSSSAWYGFGNYTKTKRVRHIDTTLSAQGNYNLVVNCYWDYGAKQTTFQLNEGPYGASALWGFGVWGVSAWGTNVSKQMRKIGDIGFGKVLSLQHYNAGANQPFQILAWDVAVVSEGARPVSAYSQNP